jgi:PAS domain-containing protein
VTLIGIETLRVQVRWLAQVLAGTMVLMFLAVALPWLLRMIEVDLGPLAWTLTAFATTHALLLIAAERLRERATLLRLLYAVPLFGVAFMAVLWHYGGGIGHAALAIPMVLPVLAAGALPRRRFAYDVALYSVFVVVATVTISSPDFAWYVTQLGVPGAALGRVAGEELAVRDPFPGATTTPAAAFLLVATFAVMQLAAAAVATHMVAFVRRRDELTERVESLHPDTLPALAAESMPVVAVLVIAATGQIVQASRRFIQQMLLHNEPVIGRELFDVIRFSDAGAMRTLLAQGGTLPSCRYAIGAEERIADVVAETFEHGGITYANVAITDAEEPA